MQKYMLFIFIAAIIAAYFFGRTAGYNTARNEFVANTTIAQNKIIKIIGNTDAESTMRGVADIRMFLRNKYTIGE